MQKEKIINAVFEEMRSALKNERSGHDWWHIYRVWKLAKAIGKKEKADLFVVELASLVHDIADWKLHGGDEAIGPQRAKNVLQKHDVPQTIIEKVCGIISSIAFQGAQVERLDVQTIEGKVVQDADRIDALGAIGIGRTFTYGGHIGRIIYDPTIEPTMHASKEEYIHITETTINHFYEKLLLLKDQMNTKTGKNIAAKRHKFMEWFLKEFYREWDGKT